MKTKHVITVLTFCLMPVALLGGEGNKEKKYQLGGRSAIITSDMELSKINPAFDDLSRDGFKGPHHSSLFFLYKVKPWLRVGFETLVGNSDENANTTFDFQGAGLFTDFYYGQRFFLAGGFHLGGMIVDVLHKETDAAGEKVNAGTFYKDEGVFFAPHVGVGMNIKSFELRLLAKTVLLIAADGNENIDGLNAPYVGLSWGWNF